MEGRSIDKEDSDLTIRPRLDAVALIKELANPGGGDYRIAPRDGKIPIYRLDFTHRKYDTRRVRIANHSALTAWLIASVMKQSRLLPA